ncbi:hypothetical protein DMC61_40050 [Amycolatopsis sp. WAC 04169]|nr:hypothetical protein DMC61_40050 [Amycolatopsis sp. WAC 04169]
MAITYPHELTTVTLRRAAEAGFSASDTQIRDAIKNAAVVAEGDGHRRPYLSLANPEHRARIERLVDRVVANRGYNDRKRYVAELGSLNVHGVKKQISDLVAERERELKNDPALLAAAQARGLPDLRPSGLFMGRSLNADNHADHEIIDRAAYALIWERKTANVDELVTQLQREGIAGSAETLQRLVASAIDEATRNGDRLQPLSITDPDHHDAIQARLESIYQATPIFFDPDMSDRVKTLVKHMRMRHITGPQEELEAYADNAPEPAAFALPELSLATIDLTGPDPFNRQKLDHENPLHISLIRELAGRAIDTHGIISNDTLALLLAKENVERKAGIFALIDAVKTDITAAGSSWYPNYRGRERQRAAQQSADLTTLLWRLATDHPQESPAQLAQRAEYAGFLGNEALVTTAHSTIATMVDDQRRHPITAVSDPAEKPRLRALIAALSTDHPGLTTDALISHLRDYNVHGSDEMFVAEVKAIREAGFSDADVAVGRELSTLRPDGRILGRRLDIAIEADLPWIDKLAYATAWAHKADTTDQLVHRLEQDGITNTDDGLRPLVARIVEEATANGDRHETLSADLPDDHDALVHRTGALVLTNPDLFDLAPPDATTALVRHMRVNHITGTQEKLRDIATTILSVRTDQPLPGALTVPIRTYADQIVEAVPLPRNGGVAFVSSIYAPNINAAFPVPEPGVVNFLAHHDTTEDTYYLPDRIDDRIPHQSVDLANTIATLPVSWSTSTTLKIWACNLTSTQHDQLAGHIRRYPALNHLAILPAHLDTPIYVTPDGRITTRNPFVVNTLFLGRKRKLDETLITVADPDDPQTADKIAKEVKDVLQEHGDLDIRHLLTYVRSDVFPERVFHARLREQFQNERKTLLDSGYLWGALYRGTQNQEHFNKGEINDYAAWLYRKVTSEGHSTATEIARSAHESGFPAPHSRLLVDIRAVIKLAEGDGRRYPELSLSKNRDQITTLIDQFLANSVDRAPSEIVKDLKRLNVHGNASALTSLVRLRERELREDSEVLAAAQERGLPVLRPTGAFLGKELDIDRDEDSAFIDKIVYATVWERKTANAEEITEILLDEGITGSPATLLELVGEAIDSADLNGDRLIPLSLNDLDRHDAIRSRTDAILDATPQIRTLAVPEQRKVLVKHMRMRHISGTQKDLESVALSSLQTSRTHPSRAFSLNPIDMNRIDASARETGAAASAEAAVTAEMIVLRYGDLAIRYLLNSTLRNAFPSGLPDTEVRRLLKAARSKLEDAEALWWPLYRGRRNSDTFDLENPNDLTVWLYRQVIENQDSSTVAIAHSAAVAGFTIGHHKLEQGVQEAMRIAEQDGRRQHKLTLSKPADRDRIVSLIDRLLANSDDRDSGTVVAALRRSNVSGASTEFKALVTQRRNVLENDTELLSAAKESGSTAPPRRPELFLGKNLSADNRADHALIDKLAYAAAWQTKSATPDEITNLLRSEGISGSEEKLRRVVTDSVEEAQRNGDRLLPLSANGDTRDAARARVQAILTATPTIRTTATPDRAALLVRHMRTRHITGTQEELEEFARTLLQESETEASNIIHLDPVDVLLPSEGAPLVFDDAEMPRAKLDVDDPVDAPIIKALARQVVDENGSLGNNILVMHLYRKNVLAKKGTNSVISAAVTEAYEAGSLWHPRYRGRGREKTKYDFVEPNDFSAVLWRLAVDHPQDTVTEIARRAEHLGFSGVQDLRLDATKAIDIAVLEQRRYPILKFGDPKAIPLIDAVIADGLGLSAGNLVAQLRKYNVRGNTKPFEDAVRERLAAERSDADVATGRAAMRLEPDGRIFGRRLDVANENDLGWIDKLAYAAAWADKTATVDQLVHQLTREGITNTDNGLTPLVTRIIDEATANGDRQETLSTNLPNDRDAILQRTGALVLKNLDLFDLTPPDATTTLVRHMRVNHITGTQQKLRDIATTILSVRTDQPLPGIHTIPIRTHDNTITHAIPLPHNSGYAFIDPTYTTNLTNAFTQPTPGTVNVLVRHNTTTDTYHLPHQPPHTPANLITTITNLPVNWSTQHTLNLWACDLTTTQHSHLTSLALDNPTLNHLALAPAYLHAPIHIAPGGGITTTDPGIDNTLHLGPTRQSLVLPEALVLPEIVPDPQSFAAQLSAEFDVIERTGERTKDLGDTSPVPLPREGAVGPAGVPALTLSFAETAATLTSIDRSAVRETAHAVAQAAALRAKWGLPGPAITVTAYSGKDLPPGGEGIAPQRRAEQVRSLLRAALAEELAASSPIRLEDIEIHAEVGDSTANGVSDGRHDVVVETSVAAVRSTAENLTVKAYDSATQGLPGLRMTRAELDGRLAEFSELAAGGRLEHQPLPPATRSQLIILNERTAALGDAELRNRVRTLVNDTLLAASLVPVRQQDLGSGGRTRGVAMDRRVIQPITPARLTQVLDELNTFIERGQDPTRTPTSLLAGLTVSPGDHLAVRLASLGLVNMSASSRDAVIADPLYRGLVRNPAALTESLFAGTGHEEQHFLNTCTPAAIHAAVRGRVPTIAGLLHLGRAVADATGHDLQRVDPAVRGKRDRPFGRTLEEMVRKRIADARAEFTSLETAAMTLVSADQAAPATKRDWNALTDRWGRTMQKLAAADLRAVSVPVLTRKVVPGDWLTSLALTSPLVVDRGSRRLTGVDQSSYVARLQPHLGFEPDGTMFGANEAVGHAPRTVRLGDALGTPESRTAFWEEVTAQGGTFLKTPNHWLHLRAAMEDERPVFVVGDAKYGNLARQTPEQFARWADSSHARAHEKLFPHLVEETSPEVGDEVIADPPDSRHYELTDAHGRDYGIGFAGSVDRGEVLVSAAAASTDHAERVVAVHSTQEDGTASRVESVQDWADFTDGETTRPFHLIFESEDGNYVATDPTGEAAVRIEPEAMAEKVFSVASFRRAASGAVRPPLIIATHETRPGGADPALNRRFLARLSELTGPWHAFEHSGKLTFERDFGVLGIDQGGRFSEISPSVSDLHFLAKDSVFAISSHSGNAASRAEIFTEATPPLRGPWGDREPIHVFLDGDPRHALARISGSHDIALGGRAIGRLLASNAEFRTQLALRPGRPVVVHSTDSGSRNDIGGLGFDMAGSLHEAGLYPPVYGIKGEPGDEAHYAAVSRLRTGDLLTTDLHRPDGTLAVRLVRTPGDESVLRRLQRWTANSTTKTLSTYVHRDGGSHRAPWDGAPVLIVAPRAPRGYLATRRDGKAGVVSPVALADVLRDDPALRQGLGADPDLSYLLVGWGGRTVGLASFAAGMARGGYARSAYAPRGTLTFRSGGRLGLTGPGFRVAEPRTPRPKDIVNFESANERLGTFGQFFPSKDFDSAAEALAALGESRGQQQYYIREVSRPDGRGGVDRVPLPYRAPWAGRDPWFTSGHGSPAGLQFALATGNPYRRGDVVSLSGAPAARAIFASEIYRRAQPDPNAGVVLGQCSANLIGTGRTVAYGIREAWGSEAVPTTIWGASEVVAVARNGERTIESGGAFFEAVAPGAVPSPPQPLVDGLGGFEPDDAEAGPSTPSDAVTLPRPGGIRIRLDPTFEGFSDDDASSATGDALFEQDDAESDAPPGSPVPSVIEDEPASAEVTAMVEWSERIGAAHDRMTERGETDPEAVSRIRDRAEHLVGELPYVDGADEEIHAFLHEGLVTLLTDALLGGASLREAWQHSDVAGLRQTLASLRERVPDAPYVEGGDEPVMTSSAAEPSGPQSSTAWGGLIRETRDWLSARAGQPEVEAGLSRARRLARSMPHAVPGADDVARNQLHQGLVVMLAEAMARGASPLEAWEAPEVARLRQDAEAARGAVRGAPYYTTLPSQELSELRTESAPSPEVRPPDAVPAEQAAPVLTGAAELGPRSDPPRLRELIEEFTWQLPEAAALRDPVLLDQAERLLGERPLPEPGYGPVSARQRELWQSAVEAVAGELARGHDGRKPAESVRARFERLHAYDALTQWAEETLARYTDEFAEAEAELRLEAERDQPSAERVLLARRQAEAMLGATAPGVQGGVSPRIRQEFHNGLLASLSRYIANGNEPEASWSYLEEARLAAENVRLTSRYLWGRTGFGVFTAETGTGYLRDSHEEPPPPYSFEEPDLRFHRETPPDYDDVVDLDHTAVDHGSLAQAADHLIRLFELARDLPGHVLIPWRARMLRHLLPPAGLSLDQLDSRLPVHNVLLTALAYQAYLDRERQDGTGDTPYLLKLDPGDLAAFLTPMLAHDRVRDNAFLALQDAFDAAKYYSES